MTDSKLDSFYKRLDNVYKFLKEQYIFHNIGIDKIKVCDLHKEYESYCISTQAGRARGLIDFNKHLKNIGIEYKTGAHNINYYTVSLDTLKEAAKKYHWIHKLDDYEPTENKNNTNAETKILPIEDDF